MTGDREEPHISSTLHWNDVLLPKSVILADLDAMILSTVQPNWRKMAAIVGTVMTQYEARSVPLSAEIIAARIQVLAEWNRIEAQGNLQMWRHSEVRLNQDNL
jgi:hypothetical protein